MLVGIYTGFKRMLDSGFLEKYEKILNYNDIESIRLDIHQEDFWSILPQLDLFIFRWGQLSDHHQLAKTILPIIEKDMKVKCFPNSETWWPFDDKIRQYYLLKTHKFPMIESWIFWDEKKALDWAQTTNYPVVFKLKSGAGSENVILVNDKIHANKLIHLMFTKGAKLGRVPDKSHIRFQHFDVKKEVRRIARIGKRLVTRVDIDSFWQKEKNYIYFQKFLPQNKYDTRITVIGGRAFAYRRFTRDNDFRASGSGKINYDKNEIDILMVKKAIEISEKLKFQSMAYDFIYNEMHQAEFCEISYTFVDKYVYNCEGYWDSKLEWHEGHFWPQYFQLMDAFKYSSITTN